MSRLEQSSLLFTELMGIQLPESYYQLPFQNLISNFPCHDQPIEENVGPKAFHPSFDDD